MSDITVVKWISYDEAQAIDEVWGGLGGWFGINTGFNKIPHRWSDYLENLNEEERPYANAVRLSILSGEHPFITGAAHQNLANGVPLFSDGKTSMFSYRGWADLMAAIKTEEDGQDHTYMEFYM